METTRIFHRLTCNLEFASRSSRVAVSRPLLPISPLRSFRCRRLSTRTMPKRPGTYGERSALETLIARRTDSTRDWMRDVDASLQDDFGPMIKRHDRLDARHFFNINLCHPLSAICRMSNPRGRHSLPLSLSLSLSLSLCLGGARAR